MLAADAFLLKELAAGQESFPRPHTDILWPSLELQALQGGTWSYAENHTALPTVLWILGGKVGLILDILFHAQQPGKAQGDGMYLEQEQVEEKEAALGKVSGPLSNKRDWRKRIA